MPDDVLATIRLLVQPVLDQCAVELFDLHWDGRTRPATLRLAIDRPEGVTLEDCERVSGATAAVLDAHDPIAEAYVLEVSSPGAERPLRNPEEWRRSVGRRVNVRFRAGDGETVLEGTLLTIDEAALEVETRPRRVRVPHPREIVDGIPPRPRPSGTPVRVPLGDVIAGRLAVEP